jgi:hypothetical protein
MKPAVDVAIPGITFLLPPIAWVLPGVRHNRRRTSLRAHGRTGRIHQVTGRFRV